MKTAILEKNEPQELEDSNEINIDQIVKQSFKIIAPFWPLKNLIAVNPLQGLEDMPIEEAMKIGTIYFQNGALPKKMEKVNRETIKWLQAYFDEGQATLTMPLRATGLYSAWRQLAIYDVKLHHNDKRKKEWLQCLPQTAEQAIANCLLKLGISQDKREVFLMLMLSTLSGWASYIKYRTEWARKDSADSPSVTQADYLAIRLITTCLIWPEAKTLLKWHEQTRPQTEMTMDMLEEVQKTENAYCFPLMQKLSAQLLPEPHIPKAQVVFCIDVRSEPLRKALETIGDYQTFGFAGFFGIPVQVNNSITGESYASCPVLLSPKHVVVESPGSKNLCRQGRSTYSRLVVLKRLYQSLKYTFTTPFALVESLGMISGMWMGLRTFVPGLATKLKLATLGCIFKPIEVKPSLENIPFIEQCAYAEGALRMIGLTEHFAPLVVLCGHGSTTQNNAYATALDCGACGGRHGASNARILTAILNRSEVRQQLISNGIVIPNNTVFVAAEHNTTTDEVILYGNVESEWILELKEDLKIASALNSAKRLHIMQAKLPCSKAIRSYTQSRSQDWAEVRPEWGLARNAAFIIAPRGLTEPFDLEGRCFLHSYDYKGDPNGSFLTSILTAPMVVAQWINAQYFFATFDNVAYGSGSKVTQNITGKIGVMQGNASDLMTGLPLQSVYKNDTETYHELQRLFVIVYAPCQLLSLIIHAQPILRKLFGNGWARLACIEPESRKTYLLNRDITWKKTL